MIGAGSIIATGGTINVRGGDGGKGNQKVYSGSPQYYFSLAGPGGGGSGGTICFISGENIALTANVLEEHRKEAQQAGFDDYLAKPVKLEELRAKVLKWVPERTKASTPA